MLQRCNFRAQTCSLGRLKLNLDLGCWLLYTPCSMADHIATRKSTFTSASTSRMTRTHTPIVNGSQKRVGVYSKGVTYGAMSKQTQAEPCVLYIRVSTTRQANQGVSLKAQIREANFTHNIRIFCFQILTFSLIGASVPKLHCGQDLQVSR